jgi:hypothetical protein
MQTQVNEDDPDIDEELEITLKILIKRFLPNQRNRSYLRN